LVKDADNREDQKMEKAKWHTRWMANHPQATLQEYSDALAHHTLLTSALVYAAGTAAFVAVIYIASLF